MNSLVERGFDFNVFELISKHLSELFVLSSKGASPLLVLLYNGHFCQSSEGLGAFCRPVHVFCPAAPLGEWEGLVLDGPNLCFLTTSTSRLKWEGRSLA